MDDRYPDAREPDDEISDARLHRLRRGHAHPAPEALQALADGAPVGREHAELASHVAGCAECRAEVDEARRVAASLSLLAAPPNDLLARVRARRAAGERVLLPGVVVPHGMRPGVSHGAAAHDQHPSAAALDRYADRYVDNQDADQEGDASYDGSVAAHVAACATCAAAVERTRRVTGALSLGSAPPDDLLARVRARRAAGARVALPPVGSHPVGSHPVGSHPVRFHPDEPARPGPRARGAVPASVRWRVASVGAVAALLLVILRYGPGPSGPVLRADLDGPGPGAPHPGAGVVALLSRPAGPLVQVGAVPGGLSVVLAGWPRDYVAPVQAQALDSLARVLAADPGRGATVRYTDPAFTHASPSWAAAQRVSDYLLLRGVAGERVALVRVARVRAVQGPLIHAGADVVEVLVQGRPVQGHAARE